MPDSEIAVGPDAIVGMSNQEISIWSKQGALLASGRLGKWLFAHLINLPDPPFPVGSQFGIKWETDSPNISVDANWVYVNALIGEVVLTPTWTYRSITFIYPKAPLMAGAALPAAKVIIEPPIGQPPASGIIQERVVYDSLANNYSYEPGVPQYMIRPRFHESDVFQVIDMSYIDMTGTDPVKVDLEFALPEGAAYRAPADMPQPLGGQLLATFDARFWGSPVYRDGHLWAVQHVRPVGVERTIIRWFKFQMNAWGPNCPTCLPTLAAWGTIDPDVMDPICNCGSYATFPSIGVDATGAAAIAYTCGGPLDLPSMHIIRTNALGQFTIDACVQSSVRPWQMINRWGDYSGCDADPVVPGRFWGHGEFVTDPFNFPSPGFQHWRTWIAPVGP